MNRFSVTIRSAHLRPWRPCPPSLPSRHLLGDPGPNDWNWGRPLGRQVAIGGCGCGDIGCWPLHVMIEVHDDVVRWRDFENPQRGVRAWDVVRGGMIAWNWSGLGPFVFFRAGRSATTCGWPERR